MKMSLILDETKEDLHMRMTELQKKLKDSEEERRMLEKTCEILIKAFREEQRIYYDALNAKYEKFLEDCNIRRRRNDIILRSLCRVEDKAKAIYAKTEKLKSLRDRYISYLKQNDFLKNEEPIKKYSSSSSQTPLNDDTGGKSVHWKTPVIADIQEYSSEESEIFNEKNQINISNMKDGEGRLGTSLENSNFILEKQPQPDSNKENVITDTDETYFEVPQSTLNVQRHQPSSSTNLLVFPANSSISTIKSNADRISDYSRYEFKSSGSEKPINNDDFHSNFKPNAEAIIESREKRMLQHQESIDKLKTTLGVETDVKKVGEADEGDSNINNTKDLKHREINNSHLKSEWECNGNEFVEIGKNDVENIKQKDEGGEEEEEKEEAVEEADSSINESPFLKGLDGVDYQNETYPESYYEQPVHSNNYSSLASKVILEEDEYELDQEENEITNGGIVINESSPILSKMSNIYPPYQNNSTVSDGCDGNEVKEKDSNDNSQLVLDIDNEVETCQQLAEDNLNKVECQGSGSDIESTDDEAKWPKTHSAKSAANDSKSDDSVNLTSEKLKNIKSPKKTNLMQLLESDSESYQIEHGDIMSGNDDSDFDFSFKQNPEF